MRYLYRMKLKAPSDHIRAVRKDDDDSSELMNFLWTHRKRIRIVKFCFVTPFEELLGCTTRRKKDDVTENVYFTYQLQWLEKNSTALVAVLRGTTDVTKSFYGLQESFGV